MKNRRDGEECWRAVVRHTTDMKERYSGLAGLTADELGILWAADRIRELEEEIARIAAEARDKGAYTWATKLEALADD